MVPEKHRKLMVHIRRMTERERRKKGEEKGRKAGVEVRVEVGRVGGRIWEEERDNKDEFVGVALQRYVVIKFLTLCRMTILQRDVIFRGTICMHTGEAPDAHKCVL